MSCSRPTQGAPRNPRGSFFESSLFFSPLEFRQPVRAVALLVLANAVHVQDAEQEVSGCDGFAFVVQMAAASELSVYAANKIVRHIEVLVLVRIPHVRSVENQGVIE